MYLEYSARLPERAAWRSCGDARAFLARLHSEADTSERFDLRLLHLTDAGQPRHAPTAIRIGSRRHSLTITGVGREAVECVQANASKAGAMLARYFGVKQEERFVAGHCDVQAATSVRSYRISSLVLLRRGFGRDRGGHTFESILREGQYEHPALIEQVSRVIRLGIERQASICLLDLPLLLLGDIKIHRLAPVFVKANVYFLVGAVSFRAGLAFCGPWHMGYLQSRGYGRLSTVAPHRPQS
ncbi:MAG: hypothetical protein INR62_00815 [Rhodospirillales bacterium]|nr:hypothetical protein [Acetobacter sp.]